MKQTVTCPKCEGRSIWHMTKLCERSADGSFDPLSVAIAPARMPGGEEPARAQGAFGSFACARCGYTELDAHGLDQMVPVPGHVMFIDNEPKATLR